MHPNIMALRSALESLHIPFSTLESFDDALLIKGKPFIRSVTPFNSESVSALCLDKDAIYKLCKGIVPIPRTYGFFDPAGQKGAISTECLPLKSLDFLYPRIVKMNKGERGKNVFRAEDDGQMSDALRTIFDKDSRDYDYLALIQECIDLKSEYRVAVAAGKPMLAYDRGSFGVVRDGLRENLNDMARKVIARVGLSWGSIDIIESLEGKLYFLEANTRPAFAGFIEKNGDRDIQRLYEAAIKNIL